MIRIILKNAILRVIEWVIFRMAEYPPPEVKYSERNCRVAKAALAVGELRELFNTRDKDQAE